MIPETNQTVRREQVPPIFIFAGEDGDEDGSYSVVVEDPTDGSEVDGEEAAAGGRGLKRRGAALRTVGRRARVSRAGDGDDKVCILRVVYHVAVCGEGGGWGRGYCADRL